jgi:hypothetical protein
VVTEGAGSRLMGDLITKTERFRTLNIVGSLFEAEK